MSFNIIHIQKIVKHVVAPSHGQTPAFAKSACKHVMVDPRTGAKYCADK